MAPRDNFSFAIRARAQPFLRSGIEYFAEYRSAVIRRGYFLFAKMQPYENGIVENFSFKGQHVCRRLVHPQAISCPPLHGGTGLSHTDQVPVVGMESGPFPALVLP